MKLIQVALGRIRLCPTETPNWFQLPSSDTNTNNGTEHVEVCAVDKNSKKLEQSEEDSREERARAKEQCLTKEPAWLRELAQTQEHGQFEPEIRKCVKTKAK